MLPMIFRPPVPKGRESSRGPRWTAESNFRLRGCHCHSVAGRKYPLIPLRSRSPDSTSVHTPEMCEQSGAASYCRCPQAVFETLSMLVQVNSRLHRRGGPPSNLPAPRPSGRLADALRDDAFSSAAFANSRAPPLGVQLVNAQAPAGGGPGGGSRGGGMGGSGVGLEPGGGSRGASLGGLVMRAMFNLVLVRISRIRCEAQRVAGGVRQ